MAKAPKWERFCKRGHDKDVVGRRADGSCAECRRYTQRRYMQNWRKAHHWTTRRLLPREPLVAAIKRHAPRYIERAGKENGYMGLSRVYAERFPDTSVKGANKYIHRLLSRQTGGIEEEMADRWCVVLNIHPIALWPSEWPLISDDEEAMA